MTDPVYRAPATAWRNGRLSGTARGLPEETAVALTYDRVSFAVMMATPQDLSDFAIGFSLSEGIIHSITDVIDLDVVEVEAGIECRMSLTPHRRDALAARRRKIAGPVGCGLCGIDSLNEAVRPARRVDSNLRLPATAIAEGFQKLARDQKLNQETRAVHAAAFLSGGNLLTREDVGRHNALDKVIGAAFQNDKTANTGAILLTSRVSIELIQKTAAFGAAILAAISVPTARAVREAEQAGITLIAIARDDGFEIFSHPERIILESQSDVA
jgi:FdhD protein